MKQELDLVLLNLHRRYINSPMNYGGFSGIYTLSAFLSENGFASKAFAGELVKGKIVLDKLCKKNLVKVVGLYCDYANVTENIFLADYVKEKYGLPVIIGGPQATALKEEFYKKSQCVAVVRYEGELTVLELMQYLLDGVGCLQDILGIAYFENGRLKINHDRPLIQNLDQLPLVDKVYSLDKMFRRNQVSIMTGRGCPFHCSFCHEGHHTRQVRFRSVDNVLREIDVFLQQLPSNGGYLMFTDDTFTLVPERVREICNALKERQKKYNFTWYCEGHVHTLFLHPEMIEYMAEAGVQRIQLGIEAGHQQSLDYYRKGCTIEEIESVVKHCIDVGIDQVFGNIILGGPFFDENIYKQNLEFADKLVRLGKGRVELGVISYWALPETSMTDQCGQYGLKIVDYDFYSSCDDFPQAETEQFDVWQICAKVSEMRKYLENLMSDMLRSGEIDKDLICRWYRYFYDYGTTGFWFGILTRNKVMFNFYEMLYSGEVKLLEECVIPVEKLHPMRVMQLYDCAEQQGIKLSFGDCCISDVFLLQLLRYSAGKLTVLEIARVLYGEYKDTTFDDFLVRVCDGCKYLQSQFLILFSEI